MLTFLITIIFLINIKIKGDYATTLEEQKKTNKLLTTNVKK